MNLLPVELYADRRIALMQLSRGSLDISEHLYYLAGLGAGKNVVEFGFRNGSSATAFLAGGCTSLVSYDIQDYPDAMERVKDDRFRFKLMNSLDADFTWCDVLFIDSDHREEHLYKELSIHHGKVRSVIAMHDTFCYKCPKLRRGLTKFMKEHGSEWRFLVEFEHNNGLSVIGRV